MWLRKSRPALFAIQSLNEKTPRFAGFSLVGAYGIRTRAAAVRGRCPRPLDECAAASSVATEVVLRGRGVGAAGRWSGYRAVSTRGRRSAGPSSGARRRRGRGSRAGIRPGRARRTSRGRRPSRAAPRAADDHQRREREQEAEERDQPLLRLERVELEVDRIAARLADEARERVPDEEEERVHVRRCSGGTRRGSGGTVAARGRSRARRTS